MSREKSKKKAPSPQTQEVTFSIGDRVYTLTQELSEAPAAGMVRVDVKDAGQNLDPTLRWGYHRTPFADGTYRQYVQANGVFPLENLHPDQVSAVSSVLSKSDYGVVTRLKFKEPVSIDILPTTAEIRTELGMILRDTRYDQGVAFVRIHTTEDSLEIEYKIDANAPAPLRNKSWWDTAQGVCLCIAHLALARAFRPLIVKGSELGFFVGEEGDLNPKYRLPKWDRLTGMYITNNRADHVRIFLDMFEKHNKVTYTQVRDQIFSTRKGSPHPLFRSGTQKITRDQFLLPLLHRLEDAHVIDALPGGGQWVITPYGRKVYESLKHDTPGSKEYAVFYRTGDEYE